MKKKISAFFNELESWQTRFLLGGGFLIILYFTLVTISIIQEFA